MDRYTFLSWLRSGAAGAIFAPEGAGGSATRAVFDVALTVDGVGALAKTLKLHGPGDVVGIAPGQVIRRFPTPGTTDAEVGRFPHVEIDDPDLPWRHTPFHERTAADPAGAVLRAQGTVVPWLCLVVVEEHEGVSLGFSPGDLLPTLRIADPAVPDQELPPPGELAAWAHVQVAGQPPAGAAAREELFDAEPHRTLARLVCPRLLEPRRSYVACVVPVFAAGRQAGLGQEITAALDERAWGAGDTEVTLPVYDSWRFTTGPGGDFEALVRRLTRVHLDDVVDDAGNPLVGTRPLDVTTPGFGVPPRPAPSTVLLFGALHLDGDAPLTPADPGLGADIAAAVDVADAVAPPVYGRWPAAAQVPGRDRWPTWLDTLNRHPGLRAVAAAGAQIVMARQEEFMAACWEQAGAVSAANQLLRQAQLARYASTALYRRHVTVLDAVAALQLLTPALTRLASPAEPTRTQWGDLAATCLPVLALSGGLRKLARPRGPLVRRVERWQNRDVPPDVSQRYDPTGIVTALAAGDRIGPPPVPIPALHATLAAAGARLAPPGKWPGKQPIPTDLDALRDRLRTLTGRVPDPPACTPADLPGAAAAAVAAVDPAVTVPRRARAQLRLPAGLWDPPDRIDPIMIAPEITSPMYALLAAQGKDWLLPGLAHVPADSVSAVAANQSFVEAVLVGMNHEMARELLWRGYPTDQRGTVFRHFWDRRVADAPPSGDVTALHTWDAATTLGTHPVAAEPPDTFVFLLRGQLLRRFPRASIFLVPAQMAGGVARPAPVDASARLPVFSGWLDPDVTFLGFDVGVAEVRGANPQTAARPGWFVAIQEQPTAPTFGLSAQSGDIGPDGRYGSWADLGVTDLAVVGGRTVNGGPVGYVDLAATTTPAFRAKAPAGSTVWDGRSGSLAAILLRRPFRFFLHGSDILPEARP